MGRIVELTAIVIIVAYVAANGASFAKVIRAIGDAYAKAVSTLMSGTD